MSSDYLVAFKYYFDVILKPYSRFMIKAIEKIKPLKIDVICPGHGPVHRENLREMINLAEKYSNEYLELVSGGEGKRVLIAYVSAYGYTKQAAEYIAQGIGEAGNFKVDVADIENISAVDLDLKLASSDAILVGSPTINQNTLLPVYKLFSLINPIRDKGKLAGAFGSYGWSGEAPKIILESFRNLKLMVFEDAASFKFSPGASKGDILIEFGKRFAQRLLENCE
jgi:flavorubredoxin